MVSWTRSSASRSLRVSRSAVPWSAPRCGSASRSKSRRSFRFVTRPSISCGMYATASAACLFPPKLCHGFVRLQELVERRPVDAQRLGHGLVGNVAAEGVDALGEGGVSLGGLDQPVVG